MKNLTKSLSLLPIVLLSACQAGKLSEKALNQLTSTSSQTSTGTNTVTNQNIILQMNGGTDLQVQVNPTPVPVPTATPKVPSPVSKVMSFFISDAVAATVAPAVVQDSYQIYYREDLLNKLSGILGSEYQMYLDAYNSYLSMESVARPTVPTLLQKDVSISFTSANGKVTSLTLPLVKVLAANSAVITYGSNAYYGIAGVALSANSVIPFRLLTGGKYYKIGSVLKLIGGVNGTVLNRAIATISFSGSAFSVSVLISALPSDVNLSKIESRVIDSALAASAGFASTHVGKYLLLYYINSSKKIYQLALLDVSSNVISATSATCASVLSYVSGYACSSALDAVK